MTIEELKDKHFYISHQHRESHTKLSIEFAVRVLEDMKLYDGGEMQSLAESVHNTTYNKHIEKKIQELKQYLNETNKTK